MAGASSSRETRKSSCHLPAQSSIPPVFSRQLSPSGEGGCLVERLIYIAGALVKAPNSPHPGECGGGTGLERGGDGEHTIYALALPKGPKRVPARLALIL